MKYELSKNGYILTTDKDSIDLKKVCKMLGESYWASERSKDAIYKSIENSLCFSILKETEGEQVGFARVITDYATYAYICDVYIDEGNRKAGLGKWLMQSILECPETLAVKKWRLVTKDAHELYRRFGFEPLINPQKYMELDRK